MTNTSDYSQMERVEGDTEYAEQRARFLDGIPSLWWAYLASIPLPYFRNAARRRCAVHADHPDYRDEWRP